MCQLKTGAPAICTLHVESNFDSSSLFHCLVVDSDDVLLTVAEEHENHCRCSAAQETPMQISRSQ